MPRLTDDILPGARRRSNTKVGSEYSAFWRLSRWRCPVVLCVYVLLPKQAFEFSFFAVAVAVAVAVALILQLVCWTFALATKHLLAMTDRPPQPLSPSAATARASWTRTPGDPGWAQNAHEVVPMHVSAWPVIEPPARRGSPSWRSARLPQPPRPSPQLDHQTSPIAPSPMAPIRSLERCIALAGA